MQNYSITFFRDLLGGSPVFDFLESLADGTMPDDPFFSEAVSRIRREAGEEFFFSDDDREKNLRKYWSVFYPEAQIIDRPIEDALKSIRERRTVSITTLNSSPVTDVPSQMTFTANVLLTLPGKDMKIEKIDLPGEIKDKIPSIANEEQLFWFDHPVRLGEKPENNEILYGLRGLSDALHFEKELGTVEKDARLDVLLSVSVTHRGLENIAAPYLRYEISRYEEIRDLNVYIFTEKDAAALLESYSGQAGQLSRSFGVDGKYGRHYNFLKAVNALWRSSMNRKLKGTFKIDLDQIFPERTLKEVTGKSAFEHFENPLWGATGIEKSGREVDLSMIAGALVNEADMAASLYTPDVSIPDTNAPLSDLIFFKHLTMALSTRAEMGTRYGAPGLPDGKKQALSRIHVTGGTNGILIDALMRYKPFTPSFIGRAEDQAYLLSVLNDDLRPSLRYYHEDGLIMRHDKQAFAGQSIEAAKDGTYIADILRVLYFSYYADALPGGREAIKDMTSPFTGSYISRYPLTMAYMRFAFKLVELYAAGDRNRADDFLKLGKKRLGTLIGQLEEDNFLIKAFNEEKKDWDLFYREIEAIDKAIVENDEEALKKRERLRKTFERCRII